MLVEVVRRGGLMGISLRGSIDTAELEADAAQPGEEAARGLRFGEPAAPPRHPDSFRYEITVIEAGSRRRAELDEAELPAALRPVVEAALAGRSPG